MPFFQRFQKGSIFWCVSIGLLVLSIQAILFVTDYHLTIDNTLLDHFTRQYRQHINPNPKVKVILVDDFSLTSLGPILGRWPWPREVHADIINFLNIGGAQAIYFDFLFSEPENNEASQDAFIHTLSQAKNTSVGMVFIQDPSLKQPIKLPDAIIKKAALNIQKPYPYQFQYFSDRQIPIPSIAQASNQIPVYTFPPDPDGIHRRSNFFFQYEDSIFPSMATAALLEVSESKQVNLFKESVTVGDFNFPVNIHAQTLINWYPKGFDIYSVSGILNSNQSLLNGDIQNILVHPSEFENSIVIVGASALGLHDLKSSPIGHKLPGPIINASILSNVLNQEVLTYIHSKWIIGISVLLLIITLLSLFSVQHAIKYAIAPSLFFILYLWTVHLFKNDHLFLPTLSILLTTSFAYLLGVIYLTVYQTIEKRKIKQTFSKYLSPAVMEEVIKDYDNINPEIGKKQEITLLFSDIRSFTSISEELSVEETVFLLNKYFDQMIAEIFKTQGTVNKLIGDAILAFWNAPIPQENHEHLACESAFKMFEKLKEFNDKWHAQGYPELKMGVGIHTGDVIIGNIGAKNRLDYTAIGDNVNLASRLEGLTKYYDCPIIISESVYNRVKEHYSCRILDKVSVKGRESACLLYSPHPKEEISFNEEWNIMFDLYQNREWEKAEVILKDLQKNRADDALITLYLKRILQYQAQQPKQNWNGVFKHLSK